MKLDINFQVKLYPSLNIVYENSKVSMYKIHVLKYLTFVNKMSKFSSFH